MNYKTIVNVRYLNDVIPAPSPDPLPHIQEPTTNDELEKMINVGYILMIVIFSLTICFTISACRLK